MGGLEKLKSLVSTFPTNAGVYRMISAEGKILYIGKAKNLKNRLTQYTQFDRHPYRIKSMVSQIDNVQYTITNNEVEALLLEARLIKEHRPPYNILLKDDKSFPYIAIDESHEFPRIFKHRGVKKKNISYYGPYPSASSVNSALSFLQKTFLLRPCKDSFFSARARPCLEFEIKRCAGPCVNKISIANYANYVLQAKDFLSGKTDNIKTELQQKMLEASAAQEYEVAGAYKNRIIALSEIQNKQSIYAKNIIDADVIALCSFGGRTAIQVFFIRGGNILGNSEYFPARTENLTDTEIAEFFLVNFYLSHPTPKNIYINVQFSNDDIENYQSALSENSGSNVTIIMPQKGEKKDFLDLAYKNAKQSLERKLAEEESSQQTLKKVQELFEIKNEIRRIEVFDNSHIFGTNAIGGMIVAGYDEENKWSFLKKYYRKFNVEAADNRLVDKNIEQKLTGGDDFYMLEQTLLRRYSRLQDEVNAGNSTYPDIVLIDGGAGQLGVAVRVFEQLNLLDKFKLICIAKGPDRNAGREDFYLPNKSAFKLPANNSVLFFLQNLRDEAHRYAITSHRAKRSKNTITSKIDEIPDIGASRKKALLTYFGSARGVEQASISELQKIPGISKNLAEKIYNWFRES